MLNEMYKTTIVIWTKYNPGHVELSDLAREAESGKAYCSCMEIEHLLDATKDADWRTLRQAFSSMVKTQRDPVHAPDGKAHARHHTAD